jgi:hypothetical protein
MSFACEKVRLKELILDTDVRDADDDIADIRLDSTQDLTEQQLLTLEDAALTKAFTAANYNASFTGAAGAVWTGAGDPIADVITAKEAVRIGLAGQEADTIAMPVSVYNSLLTNAKIIARVTSVMGPTAHVNDQTLLALFGLKEIIKIGAVKNTATKDSVGTATLAAFTIAAAKAVVFKKADPNGLRTSGFGCTIVPNQGDLKIRSWRSNDPEGEYLESSWEWALQFLSVDATTTGLSTGGFLITTL